MFVNKRKNLSAFVLRDSQITKLQFYQLIILGFAMQLSPTIWTIMAYPFAYNMNTWLLQHVHMTNWSMASGLLYFLNKIIIPSLISHRYWGEPHSFLPWWYITTAKHNPAQRARRTRVGSRCYSKLRPSTILLYGCHRLQMTRRLGY